MAVVDGRAGGRARLRPPSLFLMLAEARGLFELNSSLLLSPLLMRAPKGDGHPVLALPGFLASDLSMAPMRRYLKELGYDTHAWNMGRNLGGVASKRARVARSPAGSIHEIDRTQGQHRRLESGRRLRPRSGACRCRTWCAPSSRSAARLPTTSRATNATRLYEALSGEGIDDNPGDPARRSPATCRCRRPRSIPAPTAS